MLSYKELQEIKNYGAQIASDVIYWRRELHKCPELKMNTPKTEAKIVSFLKEIGVTDIRQGVGGHGVCAVIKGSTKGKCLAIRADCDGLPIKEETGLPYASTNGNMHACGHDAHTAMVLGAAKILMRYKDKLQGSVKLIFQPYEEGGRGAELMVSDGVMGNPHVDAAIALHNDCTGGEGYEAGDIIISSKEASANIFAYEATFRGPGAHVCVSKETPNPVYMACNAVSRIAELKEKTEESVNAVTMVHGGVRNNIVPDTCTVAGSIRAFDKKTHEKMRFDVKNILNESAKSRGGEVEISTTIDLMSTVNDIDMYNKLCAITNATFPDKPFKCRKSRSLIGEDFAIFANLVPSIYFYFHTMPENTSYPLHSPKFDVNESVLEKGSIIFASFALNWQETQEENR